MGPISAKLMIASGAGAFLIGGFVGVEATRVFYKAGQVDALNQQLEQRDKAEESKDDLIKKAEQNEKDAQEKYNQAAQRLIEMAARQPVNKETVRETFRNAQEKYAAEDPRKCLSFVIPDGMRLDAKRLIDQQITELFGDNSEIDTE